MTIYTLSPEMEEKRKKAIPSQVFYNHFFSILFHINSQHERFDLKKVPYFNSLKQRNENLCLDTIRKLLWNSWSTEYAFSMTSTVNNDDYYKFALHWNFPQAYYSIYLSMTAFHETQGIANDQHEKSIKIFGNSIKDGHYPQAISFHCKGLHEDFEYKGVDTFQGFPNKYSGLSGVASINDAHLHIASFLKSTRIKNANSKRDKCKEKKDQRFLNAKGEFRSNFRKQDWDLLYQTIPETTILNIIYRLRIKANYHDIETFINADINFEIFHKCLSSIINYLNYIHEAYIFKIIGKMEYEKIIHNFPSHLNEDLAKKRYLQFSNNC